LPFLIGERLDYSSIDWEELTRGQDW
jgi:hypothetical protein